VRFQFFHQLKDRHLAVLDEATILGGINRIHDLGEHLIDLSMQFCRQLIPIDLNQPFHGYSFFSISVLKPLLCHMPGSLGTPLSNL